ncbi:MAG: Fic family protein [Chloroflexota bacterium]|nr:Fic family protein [Chloroflexota bacterium]
MTEADDASLSGVLEKIAFSLTECIDFAAQDSETTAAKVRLLTAAATYFNLLSLADFGGRVAPARDVRLVEQVIAAAFQTYEGHDPHPSPFDKAAMLLRGITQGHPFNDGNKRTGFLTVAYYLAQMGYPLPATLPVDVIANVCLRVSAGELRDVWEIAQMIRSLWSD